MGKLYKSKELMPVIKELFIINTTKKKKTEAVLALKHIPGYKNDEEYNRHLAAIVDSSYDAIISKNFDGTITSWNKGSEKMFGYSSKQAIGENISLIIPPEYLNQEKKIVEKIRNNEIIDHFETVRVKKGGEQFYVSLTVSPLKDEAGCIIGASKIVRDISSLKKAEAELIRANKELIFQKKEKENQAAELEAVNKELESFSYSVSHDLRAPLRAINGFTRILLEDYLVQLDDEAKEILEEIISNSNKMGELIDNLLSFSRISKQHVSMVDVNIKELVNSVVAEQKQIEPTRTINLTLKKLENITGDRNMLKQVFINLISNAFKYTGKKKQTVIEIGSYHEKDDCIYYVKDNGAGFDMQYADKLFGVFQRLHSSNEFEGTGVGLAIIHKIISKHGGKVWAEAKVDEGACFYISLPVTANNQ